MKGDLGQIDGLTWLLEAATVACEEYCEMALAITDIDRLVHHDCRDYGPIALAGRPTYDFQMRTNPNSVVTTEISDFTEATTNYYLDARRGVVRFLRGHRPIVIGHYPHGLLRLTYRAGYAIDPIDLGLGVQPVPKDLQSACLMTAISIRESAKTAGPTLQQGRGGGSYYTKSATETAVPTQARGLLDRYARDWGVA
jgi:hypothetical protein